MAANEQTSTTGRPVMAASRRRSIVDLLHRDGEVTVAALEEQFGVSSMTARRDLAELERQGLARRTHGGAVLPGVAAHEDSFQHRLGVDADAKRRLGEAAAALVAPHETVYIDSSSTCWHAAQAIVAARLPVTIVTNSVPVMELVGAADQANVELIGVGGSMRRLTRSFVGPHAVRTVLEHFADKVFLSVKGLSRDGTLTDADPLEAEVKRAMISHAEEPVLLIDGSKLHTRGLAAITNVDQLACVLVDEATTEDVASLRATGIEVRRLPSGRARRGSEV
ncbi:MULTISPECIES: DeoR/GlpR family DNA-binding transcription regulator [unclassified Conexibacter]|uniref:DeoR/GlpR family DNA-binding transcription regulator n=1 Tax=unclassified Conexibacter TaxID=2627773 RepID=UPI0027179878|nr:MULTISPECIES: DeoR/GlpR family DNA-binding transcription regulator [unclassified Conexibacter]MDO8198103.1 DeoR/GlpR family DNA-binding transcription regulator [Conexibacter sp. CPCC 205762]